MSGPGGFAAGAAPEVVLEGPVGVGGAAVLSEAALRLPAGRWTCLLGASGVGKSTLLRRLAGLCDAIAPLGRLAAPPEGLEGRVAMMAQDDLLLPWLSAADNALLGARLRGARPDRARAAEVLGRVGLAEHAWKRPRQLSGGQRQRAALARTLMEDRPVILLDEPFAGLDAPTRARMQELTVELLGDRTVLLVTHDPAEAARLGHRILLMAEGGLEEIAAPAGPAPRPVDAPEVLAAQAELLRRLRAAA